MDRNDGDWNRSAWEEDATRDEWRWMDTMRGDLRKKRMRQEMSGGGWTL